MDRDKDSKKWSIFAFTQGIPLFAVQQEPYQNIFTWLIHGLRVKNFLE